MKRSRTIPIGIAVSLLVCFRSARHELVLPHSYVEGETSVSAASNNISLTEAAVSLPMYTKVLPLLPWEIRSMENRTCQPPKGVPKACCIGSVSAGGAVLFKPEVCTSREPYQRAKESSRKFLEDHPVADGSTIQCDACQIVEYLITHEWTLTFQGDSMTRQTVQGLECELARRGYHIEVDFKKWDRPQEKFWRHGLRDFTELRISRPPSHRDSSKNRPTGRIKFYSVYIPTPTPEEIELEIDTIVNGTDILVFDHGLHYSPVSQETKFLDETLLLLVGLRRRTSLKLLAWRETSAQHWNTSGGYYYSGGTDGEFARQPCTPIGSAEGLLDFRLPLMTRAANDTGFRIRNVLDPSFPSSALGPGDLVVLPFREYSSVAHGLHPEEGDCTHFCHTPFFWMPIWRTLRLAMDRVAT